MKVLRRLRDINVQILVWVLNFFTFSNFLISIFSLFYGKQLSTSVKLSLTVFTFCPGFVLLPWLCLIYARYSIPFT